MAGQTFTVDTSDIKPLQAGLDKAAAALDSAANTRLRNAAGQAAAQLLAALRQAAASSPTPQARIVADSMRIRQGVTVELEIGGGTAVGSRGTPAGAILWGSERGGQNFAAPGGGSYWIGPASEHYANGGAERVYLQAVDQILKDAGLA